MKTLKRKRVNRFEQHKYADISSSTKRGNWSPTEEISGSPPIGKGSTDIYSRPSAMYLEDLLYRDLSATISAAKKNLPSNKDLDSVLAHVVFAILNYYDKDRNIYKQLIRNTLSKPKNITPQLNRLLDDQLSFIAYFIELLKIKGRVSEKLDSKRMASSVYDIYMDVLYNFLNHPEIRVSDAIENFSTSLRTLQMGNNVRSL